MTDSSCQRQRKTDTCSRRIDGWSINTIRDSHLVMKALEMAISLRIVRTGGVVHADHQVRFTSWVFTDKDRGVGLMPSFGSVGDALDNATLESLWSSMHNEPLGLKRWTTRIELSNAMLKYINVFCNRCHRHSILSYFSQSNTSSRLTKKLPDLTEPVETKRAASQSINSTDSDPASNQRPIAT